MSTCDELFDNENSDNEVIDKENVQSSESKFDNILNLRKKCEWVLSSSEYKNESILQYR